MQNELKTTPGSVVDPVCGMQVDPAHARAIREHGGNHYFFCCTSCAERFSADPEKYLKASTQPSRELVQLGTTSPHVSKQPTRQEVAKPPTRSEEHTSELQSLRHLVCRLLLEKKKNNKNNMT